MAWQTQIDITNRTEWQLDVRSGTTVLAQVPARGSWSTEVTTSHDLQLDFRDGQGNLQMQGRATVSPDTGVYLDRGDMPGDLQSVTLGAVITPGGDYTQSRNGGQQVLPAHQFGEGGRVYLGFLQDGVE
jgi:hypothetical protein